MLFGAMTALENAKIENVDIVAAADGAKRAYDLIKETNTLRLEKTVLTK